MAAFDDYDDFLDAMLVLMWREGDADLRAALPTYVGMAEAALERDVPHLLLDTVIDPWEVEAATVDLPDDCRTVLDVRHPLYGALRYVTPAAFSRRTEGMLVYTALGRTLELALRPAPSAETPVALRLHYRSALPRWASGGASWVAAEQSDLYVAAVLAQAAKHLQEPRAQEWRAEYAELVEAARLQDARNRRGSGPLRPSMPTRVA